jgi:hypothetical protein
MAKQQPDTKSKTTNDTFSLPASSFDELKKIIQGYAGRGEAKSLSDVQRLTGVSETMISRNNSFLVETGIITEGKATKNATELGKRLGRAFEYNRAEEITSSLRDVVQQTEFLSDLPSLIRVRGGMSHDDLSGHILFSSGSANNKFKIAGANAIVQLLQEAELIADDNGTFRVKAGSNEESSTQNIPGDQPSSPPTPAQEEAPIIQPIPSRNSQTIPAGINPVAIAINIQLQLPETDNPVVYENLFKALKAHLLTPDAST